MKQTIQSKYTLELNQQEFATILAAVFSTTDEFKTKNNIICSSDLIKGLLKE